MPPSEIEELIAGLGVAIEHDPETIRGWADETVRDNPKAAGDYAAGRGAAFHALMGALMDAHGQRLLPEDAVAALKVALAATDS